MSQGRLTRAGRVLSQLPWLADGHAPGTSALSPGTSASNWHALESEALAAAAPAARYRPAQEREKAASAAEGEAMDGEEEEVLIDFWRLCLEETEVGQEWLRTVCAQLAARMLY